ncbi:hypothetical protein EV174_000813 [Coemansia sp. RSA 2320]|nr:hypothetical protein EV174_000813 [Coemansia sp. RSA 2320]
MRAMVRRAREARWIGVALMVNTLHSLAVMVPVVYVPSYAAQQFGDSPQAGAWLLSLMCFASCVGAAARPGSRWARVGLSAAVWCVWLPAGDSWAMACVFCGVYGAFMGATAATPAAGGGWADAAAALGGLTGAGWLMAGGAADVARYVPVATFAAAGSLLAAIAAVAGPCTSSTWFLRASQ